MSKRNYETEPVQVGEPATHVVGSDRYPYEVIEVSKSGKKITLRRMDARRLDAGGAYTESQDYAAASNPNGRKIKASLRQDGVFRQVYCRNYSAVHVGHARKYLDPCF